MPMLRRKSWCIDFTEFTFEVFLFFFLILIFKLTVYRVDEVRCLKAEKWSRKRVA